MMFYSWILASRPKTLTAALAPVLVGSSLSFAIHSHLNLGLSILALVIAILIQIGTNLINDALDFKKGADTGDRIGPQRATQSGWVPLEKVWWGGVICFLVALLLAIPLVYAGGFPIVVIGLLSLLAGYAYTGGPFPLAYLGLGDVFVLIFFGWIAVCGVYYLNSGLFDLNPIVAGTQVGLLATSLIAINNFRDRLTDVKASKKTLAVRFGPRFMRFEISVLCLSPFLLGMYWYQHGFVVAALLPLLLTPFAVRLTERVWRTEPSPVYNQLLAKAALLHLGFSGLLSLGLGFR